MLEVQKIACVNDAGFVMSFDVKGANGLRTDSTSNYPINQSKTIDLANTFEEGTSVWPVVDAVLGKTKSPDEHVQYKKNGQVATYQVTGGTLTYKISLIGG